MLMLWFVVALQAITPFIHTHAGAGRPGDADLLRAHPDVYDDVACHHLIEGGEQGAEVYVAQGMPLPQAALPAVDPGALYAVPAALPLRMMTGAEHSLAGGLAAVISFTRSRLVPRSGAAAPLIVLCGAPACYFSHGDHA